MPIVRLGLGALLLIAASASSARQEASDDGFIRAAVDPASREVVAGINAYSLDLFRRAAPPAQNAFLSPASVSTAVALAYRGAKGSTADELRRVLHYTAPPESYLSAQASTLRAMNFAGPGRQLRTSNALWVQHSMPLKPDYLTDIVQNAGAGLQRVDFGADPDAARHHINRWVGTETGGRIKELLREGDVTTGTRAALVNTIYWKGGWSSRFDPTATRSAAFHLLDGRSIATPLMNQTAEYQVLERDGARMIDMPYASGEVSMVIVMPNSATALPGFEKSLTADKLRRWISDLHSDTNKPRKTILTLPKMHLEWRHDLVPVFEEMGVHAAFSERADFSGMATIPYPGEVEGASGLCIQHIIHQTLLDIDEQGSEAAAATAVVVDVVVSGLRRTAPEPPPFVFRANKPFLFLLRDQRTGLILFVGRFVGPG